MKKIVKVFLITKKNLNYLVIYKIMKDINLLVVSWNRNNSYKIEIGHY